MSLNRGKPFHNDNSAFRLPSERWKFSLNKISELKGAGSIDFLVLQKGVLE
jgi:hypothetical protein